MYQLNAIINYILAMPIFSPSIYIYRHFRNRENHRENRRQNRHVVSFFVKTLN